MTTLKGILVRWLNVKASYLQSMRWDFIAVNRSMEITSCGKTSAVNIEYRQLPSQSSRQREPKLDLINQHCRDADI